MEFKRFFIVKNRKIICFKHIINYYTMYTMLCVEKYVELLCKFHMSSSILDYLVCTINSVDNDDDNNVEDKDDNKYENWVKNCK